MTPPIARPRVALPPRNPESYPTRAAVEAAPALDFPPAPMPADETPEFTRGPARRPAPTIKEPVLQWATGLATAARTVYAGWLVECQRDEALDDALASAGYDTVVIKHGGGNSVQHWAIESAKLFVLCEGLQSMGEMRHTAERFGVAFGWRVLDDGRQQSHLKARVLLRPLLEVGYTAPLLLSVKSTLTGDVLNALMRQYDVLDACAKERAAKKLQPLELPFYAFSIALAPGAEVQRGAKGTQKAIVPPVATMPAQIDRAYLLAQYVKKEWLTGIEALIAPTVAWSVAASAQIASDEGDDAHQPDA